MQNITHVNQCIGFQVDLYNLIVANVSVNITVVTFRVSDDNCNVH
jgi:hypothetical protein